MVEDIIHGPMKGGSKIFKTEMHNLICERSPRGSECHFVPVHMTDLNLIIP